MSSHKQAVGDSALHGEHSVQVWWQQLQKKQVEKKCWTVRPCSLYVLVMTARESVEIGSTSTRGAGTCGNDTGILTQ